MTDLFYPGQRLRASTLLRLVPLAAIKTANESVISSTTLQDDNELFLSIAANTNYWLDLALLATETTGKTADLKVGWTMPTGCKLDAAAAGPHLNWDTVATLEAEWAGWQNQTTSPTSTISWGTINAGVAFSYHVRGVLRNGANAGTLQLQWAQNASVAENVTVLSGSTLKLTPLP